MSQIISHFIMGESKSVSKGRRTQDLLQKHVIFTSHHLSSHTHSQALTWQERQAKEEALHLGASLQLLRFIHSNLNKWNPTDKVRPPTPHIVTFQSSVTIFHDVNVRMQNIPHFGEASKIKAMAELRET